MKNVSTAVKFQSGNKNYLHIKRGIGNEKKKKMLSHTSPILTGVPPRLGMHGRGQRSRHSGCETTLQSRHFSEILPNLIRFPQGTHDSGLMTYKKTFDEIQEAGKECQLMVLANKLKYMHCMNRAANKRRSSLTFFQYISVQTSK